MDALKITILKNGTVRIDTDAISGPNHANAETALRWIAAQMGGTVERQVKGHGHAHTHEHGHDHEHSHA